MQPSFRSLAISGPLEIQRRDCKSIPFARATRDQPRRPCNSLRRNRPRLADRGDLCADSCGACATRSSPLDQAARYPGGSAQGTQDTVTKRAFSGIKSREQRCFLVSPQWAVDDFLGRAFQGLVNHWVHKYRGNGSIRSEPGSLRAVAATGARKACRVSENLAPKCVELAASA